MRWSATLCHVVVAFVTYAAFRLTYLYVAAASDMDIIREMFPGRYDNAIQHQHDIALNVSEPEVHPLLHVNISKFGPVFNHNISYFLFRASDPRLSSVTVERIFSVTRFNFSRAMLFSVHHKAVEQSGEGTLSEGPGDANTCDMIWQKTRYGTYRNDDVAECTVNGLDDKYTVNTTMELSESYFNVLEIWSTFPQRQVLPGPRTAFHFVKRHTKTEHGVGNWA